tara:strand:- start:537 stop:929 length:393 start_codon:yes stop_codon:yes gene_type:complete
VPNLRELYREAVTKKNLLYKAESFQQAQDIVDLFKQHLPNDIGITIIRNSEVNCYRVVIETEKTKAEAERIFNDQKKRLMKEMRFKGMSEEQEKVVRNYDRKRYWAERYKNKKATKKEISKEAKSFKFKR